MAGAAVASSAAVAMAESTGMVFMAHLNGWVDGSGRRPHATATGPTRRYGAT
jgi:hypothetical protein